MDGMKVERARARNGDFALTLDGRWLCSSVDPSREARQWVDAHRGVLARTERALVLGVGAGHHLAALAREFPSLRILALTLTSPVIEAVREIHGLAVARIEFHGIENESHLLESSRVRASVRTGAILVDHVPSQAGQALAYNEVRARLKMREPLFFADWVSREPRFADLFPLQSIPGGESQQLLSIKDLDRLLHPKPGVAGADVLLIRALRELVR